MQGIDRGTLIAVLERMDGDARQPLELCVIGSAALILLGMPMRQTGDIDVWRPSSRINDAELRRIASLAGLDVNPETEDPDRPYVQLVSRGIVSLPESEGEHWPAGQDGLVLWQGDKLTVSCPPLPVLAAAKLVRASDVDLDDLVYLMNAHGVSRHDIEVSSRTFPPAQQEQARDNLDLLEVLSTRARLRRPETGGGERQ